MLKIYYLIKNTLSVKIILNRLTGVRLKEISCFLEQNLSNSFNINICSMDCCNISKDNEDICLYGGEIKKILNDYCKWYVFRNSKFSLQLSEFPYCVMDEFSIIFCKPMLNKKQFAFLGRNNAKIQYNINYDCNTILEECNQCKMKKICNGIWSSNIKYFTSECKGWK